MNQDHYEHVRVGDLGRVVTGRTPPTEVADYFGSVYPFVTPSDMNGQKTIHTAERSLSIRGAQLLKNNRLPAGSVAVSCIGWQMGKVAVIGQEAFTNQQINTIIPNGRVVPDYLYYLLSTKREELKNLGSVGTRTPILNKSAFEGIRLTLPPLPTQRKIAAVLSAYDDLIENNTRRIALLEETARALYREWFVEFRYPGHAGAPLVESPLGPIPQGWRVVKLGDIAHEVRHGIDPEEVDPETPYIGLEHLPRRSIAADEWSQASEVQSTKLIFHKGDILFGKIRPYFHKVAVAPVDGVCSTDAIVITPENSALFALTLACVSSDEFVQHAVQTSQGTKMPRANWDILTQYPVIVPSSEVLQRFSEIVEEMVAAIQEMIMRNRNLRATRDLLLPKLVSGEVDVEGVEIVAPEEAEEEAEG